MCGQSSAKELGGPIRTAEENQPCRFDQGRSHMGRRWPGLCMKAHRGSRRNRIHTTGVGALLDTCQSRSHLIVSFCHVGGVAHHVPHHVKFRSAGGERSMHFSRSVEWLIYGVFAAAKAFNLGKLGCLVYELLSNDGSVPGWVETLRIMLVRIRFKLACLHHTHPNCVSWRLTLFFGSVSTTGRWSLPQIDDIGWRTLDRTGKGQQKKIVKHHSRITPTEHRSVVMELQNVRFWRYGE
eukprot:1909474-Pyramimonas_sp.AAC.2